LPSRWAVSVSALFQHLFILIAICIVFIIVITIVFIVAVIIVIVVVFLSSLRAQRQRSPWRLREQSRILQIRSTGAPVKPRSTDSASAAI
jgi:heme/copper-type cytochrome/quinol oxidase subunit 2